MKHIKLSGKLAPNMKSVNISLVEQTHTGKEFGRTSVKSGFIKYGMDTFKHGRILLYSYGGHSMLRSYEGTIQKGTIWILLLRSGGQVEDVADRKINVTLAEWELIKEAVAAYNEWGADQ